VERRTIYNRKQRKEFMHSLVKRKIRNCISFKVFFGGGRIFNNMRGGSEESEKEFQSSLTFHHIAFYEERA
jgi:hypothetical protein